MNTTWLEFERAYLTRKGIGRQRKMMTERFGCIALPLRQLKELTELVVRARQQPLARRRSRGRFPPLHLVGLHKPKIENSG